MKPALIDENYQSPLEHVDRSHWVVEFREKLTRETRSRLTSDYGLRLDEYVSEHAYIEVLGEGTATRLESDPLVAQVKPYQPNFRVVLDAIGKRQFVTKARRRGAVRLVITLFDDGNAEAVGEVLKRHEVAFDPVGESRDIVAAVPRDRAKALAADLVTLSDVKWIEEQAEITNRTSGANAVIQSGGQGKTVLWDHGLTGDGEIAHVIDLLPDLKHCFFRDEGTDLRRKILSIRSNRHEPEFDPHGTNVASVLAGDEVNRAGNAPERGIAFAAKLTFSNRLDIYNERYTEQPATPPPLGSAREMLLKYLVLARDEGACVHNLSWGDKDNGYGNLSRAIDEFAWLNETAVLVIANENVRNDDSIPPTGSPANAKNCICVNGAHTADPRCFRDGGYGPTRDLRRKPDICAPNNVLCAYNTNDQDDCPIDKQAGTSMAAPVVSGAAVLVRQYFREGFYPSGERKPADSFQPSGALVKAVILNAAKPMIAEFEVPGDIAGWGVLSSLDDVLYFKGDSRRLHVFDVSHACGLQTNEEAKREITVSSDREPLRITLVWTDPPPSQAAKFATVNKLRLTVKSPGGDEYYGNVFVDGESVAGGCPDHKNNVEMVKIRKPAPGKWTICVRGSAVNVVHPHNGQGYALVVSAA